MPKKGHCDVLVRFLRRAYKKWKRKTISAHTISTWYLFVYYQQVPSCTSTGTVQHVRRNIERFHHSIVDRRSASGMMMVKARRRQETFFSFITLLLSDHLNVWKIAFKSVNSTAVSVVLSASIVSRRIFSLVWNLLCTILVLKVRVRKKALCKKTVVFHMLFSISKHKKVNKNIGY